MIRGNSFMVAVPVAAELAASGVAMVATPSTLLSDLVSKSALAPEALQTVSDVGNPDLIMNYGVMLQMATEDGAGNPSQHSLALGAYVDDIATVVSQHIAYARSNVKPLVLDLAEKMAASAQAIKASGDTTDVVLVVENIPEALKDESFLDTLSYFIDKTPVDPLRLELAPKSNDELRALIMVGSQRNDEQIAAWATRMEPDFFRKVWASYFGLDRDVYSESPAEMTVFARINHFLAAYLMARKISEDVQESDLSLAAYRERCLQIRDFVGSWLMISLRAAYLLVKNKTLVTGMFLSKRSIHVNGELYPEWLASGGKPEIILGMVAANNKIGNIELIDGKAEELERQWNTYTMLRTSENTNRFYDRFKLSILGDFTQQFANQDEIEQGLNAANGERVNNAIKMAGEWLATQKAKDLEDTFTVALQLVAGFRFCHTSAFQILNDINEASKANPNVDVREAATLAVINYLGDWLGDQITLKS